MDTANERNNKKRRGSPRIKLGAVTVLLITVLFPILSACDTKTNEPSITGSNSENDQPVITVTYPEDEEGIESVMDTGEPVETSNPDEETGQDTIRFPQLIEPSQDHMDAELWGTLLLVDGYLQVNDTIVVWQPGYSIQTVNGIVEVHNAGGVVVGRVGDDIYLSGGEYAPNNQLLTERIVQGTEGPFWLQGEETGLYTVPTVDTTVPDSMPDTDNTTPESPSGTDNASPEQYPEIPSDEPYTVDLSQISFPKRNNRTPEELLNTIPVYPDSVASTYLLDNSLSFEAAFPSWWTYPDHPETRELSAEYTANASAHSVIWWYHGILYSTGYQYRGNKTDYYEDITRTTIVYLIEDSNPTSYVEIRTYTRNETFLAYEICISIDVTIETAHTILDSELILVEIFHPDYGSFTISDIRVIRGLADMINSAHAEYNYIDTGGPLVAPGEDTSSHLEFSLLFYSPSMDIIPVACMTGRYDIGIHIDGYPVLRYSEVLIATLEEIVRLFYP